MDIISVVVFLQFGSYFFTIFFSKPHIVVFSFLTPISSIPSLFYLYCKFYFLLFFTLFLFPTLIIFPSPTLSKITFLPISHLLLFFLLYNVLILFPPFINFSSFVVDITLVVGVIFAGVSVICWVVLFW